MENNHHYKPCVACPYKSKGEDNPCLANLFCRAEKCALEDLANIGSDEED
jgi:hypothetical protein